MARCPQTPLEMRTMTTEAIRAALNQSTHPEGQRPLNPTMAARSNHPYSFNVVVSTSDEGGDKPTTDEGAYVVHTVDITITVPTSTPSAKGDALDAAYSYADTVYKAVLAGAGSGGFLSCVPFRFVNMATPIEGDAEYLITLSFEADAFWPA